MTLLSAPAAVLGSAPTRWYLVFTDTEGRWWWDVFTRPGFRHVYALRWDGWNWLLFNPSAEFSDIAIIAATSEDALPSLVPPGATVLEVEAFRRRDRIRGRWWIGPMTCVEQVKALLGLPVGWVFTPWQLFRFLTRCADGFEFRFRPEHGPDDAADDKTRPGPEGQERYPRRAPGLGSHFIVRRLTFPGR